MGKSKELATFTDAGGTIDGNLVVDGVSRVNSYISLGNNGYIRGDASNELRFQAGTSGVTLYNSSNSIKHMEIDASGRVTMPYQPSANVYLQSGDQGAYNNNGNVEMIASGVRHNVGNHYSTSTGRFTCPVNGVYYVAFSDNFYNSGAGTYWMPNIRKNGNIVKQAYNNVPSGGTWQHISASATVECSAGDYLSIYNYSQGGGGGGDLTAYSANIFYLIG